MSKRLSYEAYLEARDTRRFKADEKAANRLERLEIKAEAMVGQLCRDGQTVHYVYPVGGRYREGTPSSLINFLIRNRYVA